MFIRVCITTIVSLWIISCNKEADYITSIPAFDNANIVQTDTFSVEGTVYRPDSIFTGNAEYFKLGAIRDSIFGYILCRPVFRFSMPAVVEEMTANHYFDSLVITLRPQRSWQGDSTLPLNFSIKRLQEEIESESGSLFSHHRFATETVSLGEVMKNYRPRSGDSINLKLKESFGNEIFEMLKDQNAIVTSNVLFLNWLKGVEISVKEQGTGMMLELPRNDSSIQIRFHYHLDNGRTEKRYFDFVVDLSGHYYTAMDVDRSGTPLAALDGSKEIKINLANPILYTHSLTEVNTLFSFPGLKEIPKAGKYFSVIEGKFTVRPVQFDHHRFPLPGNLQLFYYSPDGWIEGPVKYPSGDETQNGNFIFDGAYGANTQYSFDLSSYVSTEMVSNYFDTKKLILKRDGFSGEMTRLYAGLPGNRNYPSKLAITFLTYKH